MNKIAKSRVNELINNATAFTDGGEWAIVNGGQNLISINALEYRDSSTIYIVEEYKTNDFIMNYDDNININNINIISLHEFSCASAAAKYYAQRIEAYALQRITQSI